MKKVFTILLILIITLIIGYFSCRNYFLSCLLNKKVEMLKNKNANLEIASAKFSGLSKVRLCGIKLAEIGKENLFSADTLIVDISLASLLRLNVKPYSLYLSGSELNIKDLKNEKNYSFLFRGRDTTEKKRSAYQERIGRLLDMLFDFPVQRIGIINMSLNMQNDSTSVKGIIKEGKKTEENFSFDLSTAEESKYSQWNFKGTLDNSNRELKIIIAAENKFSQLPFIKKKYGIVLGFDSLNFQIKQDEKEDLTITQNVTGYGLRMHHWRISEDTVRIASGAFKSTIVIHDNYFHSDSTLIKINVLPISIKGSYDAEKKDAEIFADFKDIESQVFFNSLPEGLFNDLQGIKAKGSLTYSLYFQMHYYNPDSLKFNSSLAKKDFKIIKYGSTDLSLINRDFTYTAYEKNKPVKTFVVGPANPEFTPLQDISEFLKASVLTSEDGSFFYHKGFNEDAFRQSIATNIKEKRFVRGGSTISMQLVKNVFLTRNKTVSRKIEEALIVWMIENNRIVSKERMYEVYLNIIEWGPGIYGIGEASEYYFSKKPSELTLPESIYLAMIIPRPKAFKYNFEEGHLKPFAESYYKVIAGHLLKKGLINEVQANELKSDVELTGPAKLMLKSKVEVPVEEEE